MEIPAEYLKQYHLTYVSNSSDDSDFEHTSYEFDVKLEITRLNRKATEEIDLITQQETRKRNAQLYVEKWKNMLSEEFNIFDLSGLNITHYNHEFIRMTFIPSEICDYVNQGSKKLLIKDYICIKRKYHVSLEYKLEYRRWVLKRNQVRCRDKIIHLFKDNIYDNNLKQIISDIYAIITDDTRNLVLQRKKRKEDFLAGAEITLTNDEQLLFLSKEELKIKRKKEKDIWERMRPTQHLRFHRTCNRLTGILGRATTSYKSIDSLDSEFKPKTSDNLKKFSLIFVRSSSSMDTKKVSSTPNTDNKRMNIIDEDEESLSGVDFGVSPERSVSPFTFKSQDSRFSSKITKKKMAKSSSKGHAHKRFKLYSSSSSTSPPESELSTRISRIDLDNSLSSTSTRTGRSKSI